MKLRERSLLAFLTVILFFSVTLSLFGFYIVKVHIVGQAQDQVSQSLRTVRAAYEDETRRIQTVFDFASLDTDLMAFRKNSGLDYLILLPIDAARSHATSEIVKEAISTGKTTHGNRIIEKDELEQISPELYRKARISLIPTPKSRRTDLHKIEKALVIELAKPLTELDGKIHYILYGGKMINRNFAFIDGMADKVFGQEMYDAKPVGTVTVFLDDVRVATNVLDDEGQRAIGTRVSQIVYERVVVQGKKWLDRAFVVTDWYLTAYEPIRNIYGDIIGILYVGILEKPFTNLQWQLFYAFVGIILMGALVASFFSLMLARSTADPLTKILEATKKIREGNLESKVESEAEVTEVRELMKSFNDMAEELHRRENSLAESNQKLAKINKTYLDLIGFVSHELKGLISSAVLNVHNLRDEYLGSVNVHQKKVLDVLVRSLDYLSSMVRNFLSLSRIERGQLSASSAPFLLKENILDEITETFQERAKEKSIKLVNKVGPQIYVNVDDDLIRIAGNNLVGNAIKYGLENGTVIISSRRNGDFVEVEVYNDGTPISQEDADKLFKRFSRLEATAKKERGTGLGLFIAKEIVEAHGGQIWFQTKPFGNSFYFSLQTFKQAVAAEAPEAHEEENS